MQATKTHTRTARQARPHLHQRLSQKTAIQRRGNAGANLSAFGGLGLPAIKLRSKAGFDVDALIRNGKLPEEIYNELLPAVKRFFALSRKKFIAPPDTYSYTRRIKTLYSMTEIALREENKQIGLSLHQDDKGHYLEAYYYYTGSNYEVFTLELKALEILKQRNHPLLEYILGIYALMSNYPGFYSWHDDGIFNYCATEMILESANQFADEDEEVATKMLEDALPYRKGGLADNWLNKMRGVQISQQQISRLSRMKFTGTDATLRGWILHGHNLLMEKNRQQLQQLQYRDEFDREDYGDSDPVEIERRFLICWDAEDEVMNSVVESISMDSQEFGHYSPMDIYRVGYNKPYKYNDWFERFCKWQTIGWNVLHKLIEDSKHESN